MSKRSHWIIDRGLQLKFLGLLVAVGLLNFLFYVFTLLYFFNEIEALYSSAGLLTNLPTDYFEKQHVIFLKTAIIGFTLQTVLILILGLYFSNRISGPIYRLNAVLQKVPSGEEVPMVQLRKHDFMKELADNVNRVVRHYTDCQALLVKELETLVNTPDKLTTEDRERLQELLKRISPK